MRKPDHMSLIAQTLVSTRPLITDPYAVLCSGLTPTATPTDARIVGPAGECRTDRNEAET